MSLGVWYLYGSEGLVYQGVKVKMQLRRSRYEKYVMIYLRLYELQNEKDVGTGWENEKGHTCFGHVERMADGRLPNI